MRITITARHCEVSEALRLRARRIATRLGQLFPHALDATFVFDAGPRVRTVEIRLRARRRKLLIAVGKGPDHRTALDRGEAKLRPQVLRSAAARQNARRGRARS